jgi:hypothetical protein
MKQTFPLAIAAFALSSFLLIPGCDKAQPPQNKPPVPPPAPTPQGPAASTAPAGIPQVAAPSQKPFLSISQLWEVVPAESRPASGHFTPDQLKQANQAFANLAISRPIRLTVKAAKVEKTPKGDFKGALRVAVDEPNDITKVNIWLYFETADENTVQTLTYLRPNALITVEGVIHRCEVAKAIKPGFALNMDIRSCKLIAPETQPATMPK